MEDTRYKHYFDATGVCVKCGDSARFLHVEHPEDIFCLIPDDQEELRCADVAAELVGYTRQ